MLSVCNCAIFHIIYSKFVLKLIIARNWRTILIADWWEFIDGIIIGILYSSHKPFIIIRSIISIISYCYKCEIAKIAESNYYSNFW